MTMGEEKPSLPKEREMARREFDMLRLLDIIERAFKDDYPPELAPANIKGRKAWRKNHLIELIEKELGGEGEAEATMRAFGASEFACYFWPEDTPEHRACRAAYCKGAADSRDPQ